MRNLILLIPLILMPLVNKSCVDYDPDEYYYCNGSKKAVTETYKETEIYVGPSAVDITLFDLRTIDNSEVQLIKDRPTYTSWDNINSEYFLTAFIRDGFLVARLSENRTPVDRHCKIRVIDLDSGWYATFDITQKAEEYY